MSIKWYPHHIGDYAKDTASLTILEHGAYRLLLDLYYTRGGPLLDDMKDICRSCRAVSRQERAAFFSILCKFFVKKVYPGGDAFWHNKRADEEIVKQNNIKELRHYAACKRYAKAPAKAPAKADTPTPTPTPTDNKDESLLSKTANESEAIDVKPAKRPKPGCQLSGTWKPHENHRAKCTEISANIDQLVEQFSNYHRARGTIFKDWDAAFFTWINNSTRFGTQRGGQAGGNRPGAASVVEAGLRVAARYQGET